jgi:hypothetical protein
MNWLEGARIGLDKSGSHWSVSDLLRWLTTGEATLFVGDEMHGAVYWEPPRGPSIAYLYGKWNDRDALWGYKAAKTEALKRGVSFIEIEGRKGWRRFLKQKGMT